MEDFVSLTEKRLSSLRIPCQIVSHGTYGRKTEQIAPFFGIGKGGILKTLTFISGSGHAIIAILPKGREVEIPLLENRAGLGSLRLAKSPEVKAITGMEIGGVSPFALALPVFIDSSIETEKTVILAAGDPEISAVLSGKDVEKGCPGSVRGEFTK